jgi:hypothetical protein
MSFPRSAQRQDANMGGGKKKTEDMKRSLLQQKSLTPTGIDKF